MAGYALRDVLGGKIHEIREKFAVGSFVNNALRKVTAPRVAERRRKNMVQAFEKLPTGVLLQRNDLSVHVARDKTGGSVSTEQFDHMGGWLHTEVSFADDGVFKPYVSAKSELFSPDGLMVEARSWAPGDPESTLPLYEVDRVMATAALHARHATAATKSQ